MNKKNFLVISIFLITLFWACSKNSDSSLYESAKADVEAGKFVDAIDAYKSIISQYPESNYTARIKFELGKLYQGHVLPKMPREESMKEAIKYYSEVQSAFPDSVQAISSLFMVAYLEANELGDLESAKKTYEEFLERYPNHELAESAKAELQNLGKTPEEILQEKIAKEK